MFPRRPSAIWAWTLSLAAFVVSAFIVTGCREEPPKKPAVSANLCVYLPNGMVLGPYDTKPECATARENMPGGECKPCQPKR